MYPAQLTFYTDACVIAGLQLAQSVIFPPPLRIVKLGNDLNNNNTFNLVISFLVLRPMGRFGEMRRRVLAQTFPGAILQFQKTIPPQTRKYLV